MLQVRKGRAHLAVRDAVAVLERGELAVIPTDTVYGVAAHPGRPGAEERIYRAKGRDPSKPVPLLAASVEDVAAYGAVLGPLERALAERFWPGALTMVLHVLPGPDPEGFRVPSLPLTRAILREAGGLLRVTSANRSGDPPALTAAGAAEALGDAVRLVVDAGPAPGGTPSTVVRVCDDEIEILREGAIARACLTAL